MELQSLKTNLIIAAVVGISCFAVGRYTIPTKKTDVKDTATSTVAKKTVEKESDLETTEHTIKHKDGTEETFKTTSKKTNVSLNSETDKKASTHEEHTVVKTGRLTVIGPAVTTSINDLTKFDLGVSVATQVIGPAWATFQYYPNNNRCTLSIGVGF